MLQATPCRDHLCEGVPLQAGLVMHWWKSQAKAAGLISEGLSGSGVASGAVSCSPRLFRSPQSDAGQQQVAIYHANRPYSMTVLLQCGILLEDIVALASIYSALYYRCHAVQIFIEAFSHCKSLQDDGRGRTFQLGGFGGSVLPTTLAVGTAWVQRICPATALTHHFVLHTASVAS